MEPQHNEPLYDEDPGITNNILLPSNSKMCGSRKYPYPAQRVTGNSEGEGALY